MGRRFRECARVSPVARMGPTPKIVAVVVGGQVEVDPLSPHGFKEVSISSVPTSSAVLLVRGCNLFIKGFENSRRDSYGDGFVVILEGVESAHRIAQ